MVTAGLGECYCEVWAVGELEAFFWKLLAANEILSDDLSDVAERLGVLVKETEPMQQDRCAGKL